MKHYEPVMGLEIHVQILTNSKMFCACSASYADDKPNTHCCPVCLGLPGALPTINKEAVRKTILLGLSLGCKISSPSSFSRKNYFYPDLPKGYQISQFDSPLCKNGSVKIRTDDEVKTILITEAHLEEDTGKSIHTGDYTLLDFNKSGMPLLEIVSAPELTTKDEVIAYAQDMQQRVRYLGISDGDMEKGQMRFELNISMREKGNTELPLYRVEIKNLNSFRVLGLAVDYEIKRQTNALENGERLVQETRGWDEKNLTTRVQRVKEGASDYRYFPEPDLPPMTFTPEYLDEIVAGMPELPDHKRERWKKEYALTPYEAEILTSDIYLSGVFEAAVSSMLQLKGKEYKALAAWIMGPYINIHAETGIRYEFSKLSPEHVATLIMLIKRNEITAQTGIDIAKEVVVSGADPHKIIQLRGLAKVSSGDELSGIVEAVIRDNPQAVEDFKAGKSNALSFLIGQVMKKTAGRADHSMSRTLIEEQLQHV